MAEQLPDWERLLAAAARLQGIVPDATLVGGTAAAVTAGHRQSIDADHVVTDLVANFDDVLAELESAAGWRTARVRRPVAILGSLDGILTTVRNQVRAAPLETTQVTVGRAELRVPTPAEILRIKGWMILQRNATRDFLDVAAIAAALSDDDVLAALAPMDRLYPQAGDPGAVRQQLMRQLSLPRPYDLDAVKLDEYRGLVPAWHDWATVARMCSTIAGHMATAVATGRPGWDDVEAQDRVAIRHRHLNHQRLTLAALDDIIENGTLADWRPVLARVRQNPDGPVATRIEKLLRTRDYEESGALWLAFLEQARARTADAS